MKKFVSAALAGAVAVSAVALTASGASAGGWHHPHYQSQYYGPRAYDPGPAIVAGTVFGLALGAMAAQPYYYDPYPPPPPPPMAYYRGYGNDHFNWCAATYNTYNSANDTWTDFRGFPHPCVEPY